MILSFAFPFPFYSYITNRSSEFFTFFDPMSTVDVGEFSEPLLTPAEDVPSTSTSLSAAITRNAL